jgi:hypothetical protein
VSSHKQPSEQPVKKARDPDLIRQAMADRGRLSRQEVALLAQCSKGTIGFLLSGRPISDDIARRIARAVQRPVDDLFETAAPSRGQQRRHREAVA